jgi:hypothetical protein
VFGHRRLGHVLLEASAKLEVHPGFPHEMATTQHEQINQDLLAFIKAQLSW